MRNPNKQIAFWNNSNDLRFDKINMSNMKKISHKTGKWQINRWCHHKSQKVNPSFLYFTKKKLWKKLISRIISHDTERKHLSAMNFKQVFLLRSNFKLFHALTLCQLQKFDFWFFVCEAQRLCNRRAWILCFF